MKEFFSHLIHEFELPLSNPVLIFSLILFIILLSPILLRRINIPGIIGLIISGVVIGPHGLNILEKNSAVDLFSTIGLLYIMFIAGLELDMNEFKANRNKSFLFGFLTFIIPLAIGIPVCQFFLGYDFMASLLTASMFATHTLVAYPIVSKLGISKNQAVAITVGGTILVDTAALIILAVIVGASDGGLTQDFWIRLGVSLAIFSAIMFLLIPRIAKWFFHHLESEKHSHYIFVLSVVFFAAFLAEVAGVEPIIGAFVAGLALNRLIPHSSALMNRIEFIGNSLFIPFFLISVGMLIDISAILSGPTALIVAGTLSVVGLFAKWVAAFFTQISFKYSAAQRQLIYGLSSARVAASLAVILIGYRAGIVDENILNGTIILILVTCIVSSFVTERAAKKIVISSEDDLQETEKATDVNNEHILMPVANIPKMEKLLEFVILIKDKKSANPASILTVVPNNDEAEVNIIKAKNKLENFVKQASASEINVNVIATIDHNISGGIARTSREIMANIIVVGWPHRPGMIDKIIGERVESIINHTEKTLFICHFEKALVTHKRMLIIAPPLSEKEGGFNLWFLKMVKLSQELTIPIQFHCNKTTEEFIEKLVKHKKLNLAINFNLFEDWDDFFIISKHIQDDDLIVLVSARKEAISHMGILDKLPHKLERHFKNNSRVIVYPHLFNIYDTQHHFIEGYEDITSAPLHRGIQTVQKIGRGIGNIFKKHDGD